MTSVGQIGPRQSVDRACHPTLGEGIAVYDNGPPFFQADSGEVVPMRSIDLGGCGVGGSYLTAITLTGERIRLDTTKRERGPHHERVTGRTHGPGWLVDDLRKHPDAKKGWAQWHRFEPDRGDAFEFWAKAFWVGMPADDPFAKGKRSSKKADAERLRVIDTCPWITIQDIDGDCFVYRRGAAPLPEVASEPSTQAPRPEQRSLFEVPT